MQAAFFSKVVVGIWCWKWGIDKNIHNWKPFRVHISLFCCSEGNGWFTSKHPLASLLWQSYTLAFTWKKKSKNLSLLVVKEREEGGVTDCSYTAVPHTSFLSRIAPRYRRKLQMDFWHHLQDLLFTVLLLIRTNVWIVVSSISPSWGELSGRGNCPVWYPCHFHVTI